MFTSFKLWLESEYDVWRNKVDSINRRFAFTSWFPPNGRVYIPLETSAIHDGYDKEVVEFLEDHGYKIKDYKNGITIDQSGREYRIGRILDKIAKQEMKELLSKLQVSNASPMKIKQEIESQNKYIIDIQKIFQTSIYRTAKNQKSRYTVVISSDPHDIASMSTGRDWVSCMELGKGANYQDIFCEVKDGGFVAYLIRSDDINIQKPLARISIKRFENKIGQSIAIPEETVYGNELPGFTETVKRWIDSKQGKVPLGVYKRRGGEYSDTLEDKYITKPETANDIFRLIKFHQKKYNDTALNAAINGFFSSNKKWGPKLIKIIKDLIESSLVLMISYGKEFAERYPDQVDEDFYSKIPKYEMNKILKKNPEMLSVYKDKVAREINDKLSIDNEDLKINKEESGFNWSSFSEIKEMLSQLEIFDQLPEPIIRKLTSFARDVLNKYKDEVKSSSVRNFLGHSPVISLLTSIIHSLNKSDTPTVISLYKDLLPYWDRFGGSRLLGITLARLGRNGEPFIPFLKEKLKELETNPDRYEKEIENINYIIDSIENGQGRSDKYHFSWGSSYQKS